MRPLGALSQQPDPQWSPRHAEPQWSPRHAFPQQLDTHGSSPRHAFLQQTGTAVLPRPFSKSARGAVLKLPPEPSVERLKSELAAAHFQLQVAQQVKDPLAKLLVPVEEVRNELNIERHRLACANDDKRRLESECQSLADKVAELEKALLDAQAGSSIWQARATADRDAGPRNRCLQLEHACATLAVAKDTLQSELQEAQFREQGVTMKCMQLRVACTEAENAEMQAQSEARQCMIPVETLEQRLAHREREGERLRAELREERAEGGAARASLERLRREHETLRADSEEQLRTLHDAMRSCGELQSRNDGLEFDLALAQRAQAVAAPPQAVAPEPPAAQPAPVARELAIPSCPDPPETAHHEPVNSWSSPLRSPQDRRNYPRGAHSRRQRNRVLGLDMDAAAPCGAPGLAVG